MISLVRTVDVHGEAIDYDLMTRTRWTLRDWEEGRLDSRSLTRFVKGLGPGSAFFKASSPDQADTAAWVDGTATCALIAELIDAMRSGMTALAYKGTGKRPPNVEPYPRPWAKGRTASYGRDAIPIEDFDEWYYGGDSWQRKSASPTST